VHNIHQHISYKTLEVAREIGARVFLTAHDAMSVHYGKFVPRTSPNDLKVNPFKLFHDYRFRYNPFRNYFIKNYLANVTRIFAVSDALKKILEANGLSHVEVLHNGIDVNAWKAEPAELADFKKAHNLEGKKVILFGGRLSALKGGQAMVDAFALLAQKIPEARLVVVGSTEGYFQKVMTTLNDNSIKEKIIATGWIERAGMKTLYAAADVVTVPSLYTDPFPTVNLEAMAAGKPVIGTCFGGTPEAVVNNETGFIVDPHDSPLFAQKLSEFLTDTKKAESFGQKGYERARTLFSLEKHVDELTLWYTDVSK